MNAKRTLDLSGRPVSDQILKASETRWRGEIRSQDPVPCLASVALGTDSPFHIYQRQQRKVAERLGMLFREVVMPIGSTERVVRELLRSLDRDTSIHGIILQHPLPRGLDFYSLIQEVTPNKDVDGVGPQSMGMLMARRPIHVPAVALATREILRFYNLSPSGKRVVIVGRSETVGLPTAILFLMKEEWGDATVTVAHSATRGLDEVILSGEIVISCAGKPGIVRRQNVAEDAIVIDVGLSTVPDPSKHGGLRGAGDVDRSDMEGWVKAITPVPGGVGPVTVAELMRSVVVGWERSLNIKAGP